MSEELKYVPSPRYIVSLWFRKILVPIDGSGLATKALDLAIDFAKRYGSKITALYIIPDHVSEDIAEPIKKSVIERQEKSGIKIEFKIRRMRFPASSIAKEIINEAEEGLYDAILLGARGLSGEEEIPIGSIATAVAILAPCTVIIVR